MDREIQDQLYDPGKQRKGSWLDFVKAHKHIRTANGLLDLKAISKLWKGKRGYDPAPKGQRQSIVSEAQRAAMFAEIDRRAHSKILQKARRKATARGRQLGFDPVLKEHGLSRPPKNWFYAMLRGIKKRSDVRDPAAIVGNIWKRLSPGKRASIKSRESKGERFKYDLPLPDDKKTKGTGTLRMVKPFKLAEVQVNLSIKDYFDALKSGLFSKMKRNDGSIALVKRCKSSSGNANIFVDKVR